MIRTGLIASLAAIAVMIGAWAWLAQALPANVDHVPVHWGGAGGPDRYGSRAEALMFFGLLPGIGAVVALLLAVMPSLDPMRPNVRKSGRVYLVAWIGAEAMLALISIGVAIMTVRNVVGAEAVNSRLFVRFIIAAVGLLFIFIGDALPKTRPNFFIGVRTPWTLTSDLAWEKTHRLAGRLFVLVGLWGVISAFALTGISLAFAIAVPAIAVAAICAVYSYLVWRGDPARRRPLEEA